MSDRRPIPLLAPKVFWDIIEAARHQTEPEFVRALQELLVRLEPEEIIGFHHRLWHYLGLANRADLWKAAAGLMGWCSEDGFRYFGCWLVSQGRLVFENALDHPDILADYFHLDDFNREQLMSSAYQAWETRTGLDDRAFAELAKEAEQSPWPDLYIPNWDVNNDDELRKRFPRLWAGVLER